MLIYVQLLCILQLSYTPSNPAQVAIQIIDDKNTAETVSNRNDLKLQPCFRHLDQFQGQATAQLELYGKKISAEMNQVIHSIPLQSNILLTS